MNFVVVGFGLEVVDCLLPVGSENIAIIAMQALIDLLHISRKSSRCSGRLHLPTLLDIIPTPVQSLVQKATGTVSDSTNLEYSMRLRSEFRFTYCCACA